MKNTYQKTDEVMSGIDHTDEPEGIRFKASEDMLLRKIAGEYLLIPVGPLALKVHGMVTLSESGYLIWQQLQIESDITELTDAILAEYEVSQETAKGDVRAFLKKLDDLGALERVEGDK